MSEIRVSIVVPTRDRPAHVARCLAALGQVTASDEDVEIVVVNDGGAPVHPGAPSGASVTVVDQAPAGPAAARNAGARAARGRILVFTDDDCEPEPGWLPALERRLEAAPSAVVGGRVVAADVANVWSAASQLLLDHLFRWYNRVPSRARFAMSSNLAVASETFRALGGFDDAFPTAAAEDRELVERALARGLEVVFAPEAAVRHRHRLDGAAFLRQQFGYGRGAYRLVQARRREGGGLNLEPLAFYTALLDVGGEAMSGRRALQVRGVLLLSQVAHAAGFVRQALASRSGGAKTGPTSAPRDEDELRRAGRSEGA